VRLVLRGNVFLRHVFLLALCGALSPVCGGGETLDLVKFNDGTVIRGRILSMTGGEVTVQPAAGGSLKVGWDKVVELASGKTLVIRLKDGTELRGVALPGAEPGTIKVKSAGITSPATVPLEAVEAINPPEKKPVTYRGSLNAGASLSDGNTRNRTANLIGEFEARSERHRLTLGASYNYAEDSERITQRNAKGRMKYDFFPTKRLFIFASAFLEGDKFQDLNLRTALSAGPGYQFIDEGDFAGDWFSKMELYAEAGLAYFNEDFKTAQDNSYVSARWSVKFDWPLASLGATLFHYHEGYPGLKQAKDLYVTTEQGIRFHLWKNVTAGFQVNFRWDNTPAKGFKRTDTLYIATIGYVFDL